VLSRIHLCLGSDSVMHGLLIRDKKELSEKEKAEDVLAGESAMAKLRDMIERKKRRDYSVESLSLTLDLLKLNPELTLAWNFRREILLSLSSSLRDELELLNSVMVDMRMTKSYCLWNHRRWVLLEMNRRAEIAQGDLESEMKIVETIHSLDSRNFHAWSYRKFLIDQFDVKVDDLAYSTKLIESDFSNYSAWFLRTKVPVEKLNPLDELDFVWNAIFTEPNDQSAWQYHDWLMDTFSGEEIRVKDGEYMEELESVIDAKDSKYVLLNKLRRGDGEAAKIRRKLCEIDPMRAGYYNRE